MADPTPDEVQQYIAAGLPCTHLAVEGDGQHFFATIVSARVRRQEPVSCATSAFTRPSAMRMREQIHALSMKTLTPAEWAAQS